MCGLGALHGIHAQFMMQSALRHIGKMIGLLRGSGTRFAILFYAMIRVLRCQDPLLATINQAKFTELVLNDRAQPAVINIEDKKFWKSIYTILLRATFPAL